MRYRKLRIAWSVACGVACVVLLVLWVRSYWWYDSLGCVGFFWLDSIEGHVAIFDSAFVSRTPGDPLWDVLSVTSDVSPETPGNYLFGAPYWSLELASIALTVVPWLRWSNRFTLRTLLIATTLVAVVLGLFVWLR